MESVWRVAHGQHWVLWEVGRIVVVEQVAHFERAISVLFQVERVLAKVFQGRVDPGMSNVRDAVELEDNDLAGFCAGEYALEMIESPTGIGIASRRHHEGMVPGYIEGGAGFDFSIS